MRFAAQSIRRKTGKRRRLLGGKGDVELASKTGILLIERSEIRRKRIPTAMEF
jgi:hypothetical protein